MNLHIRFLLGSLLLAGCAAEPTRALSGTRFSTSCMSQMGHDTRTCDWQARKMCDKEPIARESTSMAAGEDETITVFYYCP